MKRLHKVFALSSVLLLCATIWLLAVDHRRPWKRIQRTGDRIEARLTEWRKRQALADDVLSEQDRLRQTLSELASKELSEELLMAFRTEVVRDARERQAAAPSFGDLEGSLADLRAQAAAAQSARDAWHAARLETDKARLQAEDAAARAGSDAPEEDELQRQLRALRAESDAAGQAEQEALAARLQAEASVAARRATVLTQLQAWVDAARFREEQWQRQRRFESAELDAAKAQYALAVRDDEPADVRADLQQQLDRRRADIGRLTAAEDTAAEHHGRLQSLLAQLTQQEDAVRKKLDALVRESIRLDQVWDEKQSTYFRFDGYLPRPGKKWLELPILDAFNSPRKIENLWSEGLDQPLGSFGRVRRFDRCGTCHQAMQDALAEAPDQPTLPPTFTINLTLELPPPDTDSSERNAPGTEHVQQQLSDWFGFELAAEGLLQTNAPTVRRVRAKSPAAAAQLGYRSGQTVSAHRLRDQLLASTPPCVSHMTPTVPGLLVGDVITHVDLQRIPDRVDGHTWVAEQLVDAVRAQRTALAAGDQPRASIALTVKRGLPHPYAGHPRLDLFVGPQSPHPVTRFGCTVCHEGQGSATDFQWASHTPSDSTSRQHWKQQHGWFDNSHWDFPMLPQRFAESMCLKCHYRVVDLEPSARFPKSPAPKLLEGYRLIRTYGCFGCHEIDGFGRPDQRVAPDLRLESNYAAAALELRGMPDSGYAALADDERALIDQLGANPEDDAVRRQLLRVLRDDARRGPARDASQVAAAAPPATDTRRFSDYVHDTLAPLLKDQGTPGTLRRVGPALRHVGAKLDAAFLYDWIERPQRFRPDARMPQAFGLWNHLPDDDVARQFEPLAVYSMAAYLRERSQSFDYLASPQQVTPVRTAEQRQAQIERGKIAFEERGCLACHDHADFPDVSRYRDTDSVLLGPNLSNTAAKFAADRHPRGAQWLYSWIKQPTRYDVRTTMPDSQLEPLEQRDDSGQVVAVTDPAADLVAYLMSRPAGDWQPSPDAILELDTSQQRTLDELALTHLRDDFPEATARRYLQEGIPAEQARALTGPERELVIDQSAEGAVSAAEMLRKRVMYVGRKSLLANGCYACHDIPGLEAAKPIGPILTGWGRKDTAELAFGQVVPYLRQRDGAEAAEPSAPPHAASDTYFLEELQSQSRVGFIYRKLSEPRSFDYQDTRNKKYTARLRMPQFPLTPAEREAVMTFVLGLVSDPPTDQFAYQPDERTQALIDGREVLDKYQCRSCHMLEPQTWRLAFPPDTFGPQARQPTFPFVLHASSGEQLAAARQTDRRDLRTAQVQGLPALGADGRVVIFDEDEFPLAEEDDAQYDFDRLLFGFDLWKPAALDGWSYQVGDGSLVVAGRHFDGRRDAQGGALAKYLLPRVVERERLANPNAKGAEAWAWLPPPLMGEGSKVQPTWLHDYLLDPYLVRPATVMRMPKFNLSKSEARKLTDYFAAVDGSQFPYPFTAERRHQHLAAADARYAERLASLPAAGALDGEQPVSGRHLRDAMNFVTDNSYCVRCHRVGDFRPSGLDRGQAPDLTDVYRRLRPDYLRTWIAKPTALLPYASMPVNIPYDPDAPELGTTVPQKLYHGNSVQQLDALVDLLMNYDQYARQELRVEPGR